MNTVNVNAFHTDLIVEELTRCGITFFCVSPGSRSTPLTLAVAANSKATSRIHFDERGAAFYALGYVRAIGKPAVLVCTSGTAVANYLPAVVEASNDALPLILITADRPPELQDCGANQTITQPGIFGSFVRHEANLECPSADTDPTDILQQIDLAVSKALEAPYGPVHINCQFREPLAPVEDGSDLSNSLSRLGDWQASQMPFSSSESQPFTVSTDLIQRLADRINATSGLLIVGRLFDSEQRDPVLSLVDKLRWPVFADATSGLSAIDHECIIHHFDLLLQSETFRSSVCHRQVLHIGGQYVSKRLLQFIESAELEGYIHIGNDPRPKDPGRRVTDNVTCNIARCCEALVPLVDACDGNKGWRRQSSTAEAAILKECKATPEATEPGIVRALLENRHKGGGLFIASSMPIRNIDMFAGPGHGSLKIGANRGASGIDGTIASAAGYAVGLDKPVTLLIGDLACLHDLNSLALLNNNSQSVTVVILNNNGGRIFEHLPVAEFKEHFESCFVTPHGLSFEHAAQMFNLPYECVNTTDAFVQSYTKAQDRLISTVIEVTVDPTTNRTTHRCIVERIKHELDEG